MVAEPARMSDSTPYFGPLDLEPIYDAVDLAYQSIERPEKLANALGAVARLAGATHVLLIAESPVAQRRLVAEGHADPRRAGTPVESTASGGFRFPMGTRTVPLGGGYELVLDVDALGGTALASLLRVTPHLARALRLADRVGGSTHVATNGFEPALDRLALGVALLDSEGLVLALNRPARAVISSSSLVGIQRGRIEPAQSVPRTLFETLVERVLSPPAAQRRFAGGRIELRAPGRATVELVVTPYLAHLERGEARCAVLVSSPGAVPGPLEIFRALHGLAPEEARVAAHLVAGRDPATAMDELPAEQIKAIQERVFGKLGSTRQHDLVRILLRPPGVLFETPPE